MASQHYTRLDDDGKFPGRRLEHNPFKIIVFILFLVACFIFVVNFAQDEQRQDFQSETFQAWYNCVYPKLRPYKGNYEEFWFNFVNLTKDCDDLEVFKALDTRPVANTDEVKYIAYPRREENISMVTIGVGHDVDAEIRLKEIYPKTEFFGVDPISEGNKDLYEKKLGGSFFDIALSGQGGMYKSHVFRSGYRNEITMHIGASYFFGEMLRKSKIDIVWIDNEGHEYTILELLHRGGEFEERGVKICQMNVEMHKDTYKESHGEKQKFHDFVWKVLEDGKYVMIKPFFVSWRNKGFIRTFVVNVGDQECSDLYLN